MNEQDEARAGKREMLDPNERVTVNVGGRTFETLVSTLTASSSYFQTIFSAEWKQEGKQELFLDHDPQLFAHVLSFMRYGHLDEKHMTNELLQLAEYLGMKGLLSAAEKTEDPMLEYATLYLHKPQKNYNLNDNEPPPYRAGLRSPLFSHIVTDSPIEIDADTDTGGFFLPIFALNWLGKHGFEVAPAELQKFDNNEQAAKHLHSNYVRITHPLSLGTFLNEMLFVRRSPTDDSNTHSSTCKCAPVQYATLNAVKSLNNQVDIQCAGGATEMVPRLNNASLRKCGRLRCTNMAVAMGWLDRHGFRTRETQIEELLSKAQNETADSFYGPTLVFSRPLCEIEPLMPEEYLVKVHFKDTTIEDMIRRGRVGRR